VHRAKNNEGVVILKSKKWRIGAILLAVVIFTGVMAGISFAGDGQTKIDLEGVYQNFISKLAANLGIDQSIVETAINNTRQQILDEAVQEGKITQEQADKISSNPICGLAGGFGFLNGKEGPGELGLAARGRNLDDMANILGITAEELKAEMESGKNMEQIATEHGLTMEQFHEKTLELRKAEISQALENGEITQEQADKMLEGLEKGPRNHAFGGKGLEGPGNRTSEESNDNQ